MVLLMVEFIIAKGKNVINISKNKFVSFSKMSRKLTQFKKKCYLLWSTSFSLSESTGEAVAETTVSPSCSVNGHAYVGQHRTAGNKKWRTKSRTLPRNQRPVFNI